MSDPAVQAETVEVSDPTSTVVSTGAEKPTREQVIGERGWSAEEADKAEKRGMLAPKVEEKKPEVKAEEKPPVVEKKPEVRRSADHEFEMTPEQEEAFHKIFPAGTKPSSFFTGMKIERIKRQQAAREAEQLRQEAATWKAKAEALEKLGGRKPEPVVDENGNEIDPDDKPLTLRQIREMQKKAQEEAEQRQREIENRSQAATEAHQEQEELARQMYPDFDDALKAAGELATKLNDLIPDPVENKFVRKLMVEFQKAVANADKIGPNDLNAAELAYKLGRLHPTYGQKPKTDIEPTTGLKPESDPKHKGNGGLTPEQLKRLETNTQRRASSASIPGGSGKKAVAPEEVTVDQLNRMSGEARSRFREKYPEHYSKLLRG